MRLTERIRRYLEKHTDEWVSKKELIQKASRKGYDYEEIVAAFDELEEIMGVGMMYIAQSDTHHKPGVWYRWYNFTPEEIQRMPEEIQRMKEEIQRMKEADEYFESL